MVAITAEGSMIVMPTLYLTEDRALVRRDSEDCLLVQITERRDRDGTVLVPARKEHIPLLKIDDVVVMGEVTLTASALHLLLERNIDISFLGYYGQFKGRLSPPLSKNALLRLAQYRAHNDITKRCELARQFVLGKLSNQRTLLQRYHRRQPDEDLDHSIDQMAECLRQLVLVPLDAIHTTGQPLQGGDHRVEDTPLELILGIEGKGSAAYFRSFGKLINNQEQWPFAARVKRPPTDPVNSLLSFGYSLLTGKVASVAQLTGFDHFIGYLHSSFYGRPSLALDLVEEFRPIIVDQMILTLLNKRVLTPEDFVVEAGIYRLKNERRKIFFTAFEERLKEESAHPIFGYKATYQRCIELQARLLAKYLTNEIDRYPPFFTK
jgi:CRISPR-associated protein Cas1